MTKTVRSVLKTLNVLEALNRNNGATVTAIATETGLPRGTVFRLLETLVEGGYALRDTETGTLWLTSQVKQLSVGFADVDWLAEKAKPLMFDLAEDVLWPVTLTTPKGAALVSRITTDLASPYTEIPNVTGIAIQVLGSAAGFAYLAHCPKRKRDALIKQSLEQFPLADDVLKQRLALLNSSLPTIQKQGYAYYRGDYRSAAISIPILVNKKVEACLSMRFFASALDSNTLTADYLPKLQQVAERLQGIIGDGTPVGDGTPAP
ncbi:MAG: helix-turn-helix domain-containing protein [Rhodospirillaceae bacterium]